MQNENLTFQRKGAKSNSHVGSVFEELVRFLFQQNGLILVPSIPVEIGFGIEPKIHKFDLGTDDKSVLVECKSHRWTSGDNIPSAKLTVWNEAMLYFHLSPPKSRKIFCVLRDWSGRRRLTLAEYYIKNKSHLIPSDVEIWELNDTINKLAQLR